MATSAPMTLSRGLLQVLIVTATGGAVGTGIGIVLGAASPGFYESMFVRAAERPGFDPIAMGTGLGLIQGAMVGALIGVVLVAVLTWQHVRLATKR